MEDAFAIMVESIGLKRRRNDDDDDYEVDEFGTSKKWDDPDLLEEMGVSKLGSDSSSSEEEFKGIIVSEVPDDSENENRPTKKRKLSESAREPLREQPPTSNIAENKLTSLESCELKKLKPTKCVIKNSQIVYSGNEDRVKKKRTSDACNNDLKLGRLSLKKEEEPRGKDYFNELPDELLLEIMEKLDRQSLVACCRVSRRFNCVAGKESLWCRVDLGGRHLAKGTLTHVLRRSPLILRLASAYIPYPQILPRQLHSNFAAKVQYLDLSMASIMPTCLAKLLGYCSRLKKLSLENCVLSNDVMAAVAGNKGLEVVNLTMCGGITTKGMTKFLTQCQRLQSLNISWTGLCEATVEYVAQNLPSTVERLNISGCRLNLKDSSVLDILERCDNLLELDISDCIDLTQKAVEHIVKHGHGLEYLAVSRCYSMPVESLMTLNKLESLIFLDMFGLVSEQELRQIRPSFINKKINQFVFSSVARPTVGVRRTSVWGLRVRD